MLLLAAHINKIALCLTLLSCSIERHTVLYIFIDDLFKDWKDKQIKNNLVSPCALSPFCLLVCSQISTLPPIPHLSIPGHPVRQGRCGLLRAPQPSSAWFQPASVLRYSVTSLTVMKPTITGSQWVAHVHDALFTFYMWHWYVVRCLVSSVFVTAMYACCYTIKFDKINFWHLMVSLSRN